MFKFAKTCFALCLLVFLIGCGGEDEASPTGSDLEGTWTAISFTADVTTSITGDGVNSTSTSTIEGSDLTYDVTFGASDWTTNGGYTIASNSTTTAGGTTFEQSSTDSYTDVSGSGTYSTAGNIMTIDGSFFELVINGVEVMGTSGPQDVEYTINSNGNLVFSQNETTTQTTQGIVSMSTVVSESVWEKQ